MSEERVVYGLPAALVFSLLAVLPAEALSEASRKNPKALARAVQLSPSFEANQGQTNPSVKFVARGRGYVLFLTANEAVLAFQTVERRPESKEGEEVHRAWSGSSSHPPLTIKLLGANPSPEIKGIHELPGKSHYFLGGDPLRWHTNVPSYARVQYRDVYPGVDLVYYGNGRHLEYDFVLAPGADPDAIKLAFEGAGKLEIDAEGNLVLQVGQGQILLRKPFFYQEVDGKKREILGGYVLNRKSKIAEDSTIQNPKPVLSPSEIQNRTVGFQLASYDANQPLVIDPVLAYSTYLGGLAAELGNSITLDSAGNIYVTGQTDSPNFPTADAIQPTNGGTSDAFALKLDPTGSVLLYSTYLGGTLEDRGNGIAVDGEGNAYITGRAGSLDFPVTPGALQPNFRGGMFDAFVAKLSSDGSALLYSTYLGGFANDTGFGIVVDLGGNAHVAGGTMSDDFPVTASALQPIPGGSTDAYITKLDATGAGLIYSTYLGGSGNDRANSIALNLNGDAYVTGHTESTDFPVTNAHQPNNGGGRDAFVARLNAEGNTLIYSTYLGGNSEDSGLGIAVDFDASAYITGHTDSTDFPTANAYQSNNGGGRDAYVTKVNAGGSLIYSTYLGGSNSENLVAMGATVGAIAVDTSANAYVTGATRSVDFPTANAVQPVFGGGLDDAFVAKVSADGSALLYSTYLGGNSSDTGAGIAVDWGGTAYVTGETRSANFPTANAFQPDLAGSSDVFVAAISDATGGTTTLTVSPTSVMTGDTVTVAWTGIPSPTPEDWIGLYPQGADDSQPIDWFYVSCSQVPGGAQADGSCPFVVSINLPDGTYEFRLFANGSMTRLATSNPLMVGSGGGTTALTVTPTSVLAGDTVTVAWTGIPSPTPEHWIGLYPQGADDSQPIDWFYVSCSQVPGGAQAEGSCPFVVPAFPDGVYEMRLFGNNTMMRLAISNPFTIQGGLATLRRQLVPSSPTSTVAGSLKNLFGIDHCFSHTKLP